MGNEARTMPPAPKVEGGIPCICPTMVQAVILPGVYFPPSWVRLTASRRG